MILTKDKLYKYLFYLYFTLLPLVAAMEGFSSGSNKIFNAAFLVILLLSIFDLYRKTYLNRYIVSFFALAISILLTSSIVYGLDLTTVYDAGIDEAFKIALRVLMLASMTYFSYLLVRHEVLKLQDFLNISLFLVLAMIASQVLGVQVADEIGAKGSQYALKGVASHVAITSSILLSVVPILLIGLNRSLLSSVALILCFIAITFTFRRSAWVIFFGLVIIHVYVTYLTSGKDIFQQIKIASFVLLAVFGATAFLTFNPEIYQAILVRLQDLNIAEGGTGAGRSVFWGILVEYMFEQPIINFMFGNGTGFIQSLLENRFGLYIGAHNDWLDFFLTFGIFPLLIYVIMLFILLVELLRKNVEYKLLLFYCVFSLFMLSTTTGGSFDTYFAFLHATVGFVLATQNSLKDKAHA